jgi:metal-responsive CopG/Arc/MetJ family transcriptional regulator
MEKTTDIHISLPDCLIENLDRLARERRVRRAHLVREAVAGFLSRVEAEQIQRQMAEYVEALSGHSEEFIAETDAHTVQRLLRETKW